MMMVLVKRYFLDMRFCQMSGRREHYSQQVLEHPNTDGSDVFDRAKLSLPNRLIK